MTAPHGCAAVREFYGDPSVLVREDGTVSPFWESRTTIVPFPAPLPLGWDRSKFARGARVHHLIADETQRVFRLLEKEGVWPLMRTFDGGYAWRQQRGSTSRLSMHAFGAALDFNAETNRQGRPGDMPTEIVRVFEGCGWTWGGRWEGSRTDPMHFQFAKGC